MKYQVGDRFYLDGQQAICNQLVEIYNILNVNDRIPEDKYLCILEEDTEGYGQYNQASYAIMDDFIFDHCGYLKI